VDNLLPIIEMQLHILLHFLKMFEVQYQVALNVCG